MTVSHAADSPEFMHEKNHGGATGSGLKSRSCLIASGTGGRLSLALEDATSLVVPYWGSKLRRALVGARKASISSSLSCLRWVSCLLCWNFLVECPQKGLWIIFTDYY